MKLTIEIRESDLEANEPTFERAIKRALLNRQFEFDEICSTLEELIIHADETILACPLTDEMKDAAFGQCDLPKKFELNFKTEA